MAEIAQGGDSHGKGGKKRSKKLSTRVDMTPMVDLGFLLITFFVLVTTFNKPAAMDLNLPAKEDDPKEKPDIKASKVVQLIPGPNNMMYYFRGIDDIKVDSADISSPKAVASVLDKMTKEVIGQWGHRDSLVLLIKPMQRSNYKNMVDILDEVSVAQVKRFAMVDLSKEDSLLVYSAVKGLAAPK